MMRQYVGPGAAESSSPVRVSTPQVLTALLIGSAVLIGLAIVRERWLYAVGIFALPFLLGWPVRLSLGLFAFLIPLEPITILGNDQSGTTLTWVSGAATGFILLAAGLVGGRFQRPPRAALWWSLLVAWTASTSLWAVDLQSSLQYLPTLFGLLMLYLAAVSFRISREELSWVVRLAIVGGICASVIALCQSLGSGADIRGALMNGARKTDPNYFAASLLVAFSLAIGAFLSSRRAITKIASLAAVGVIGSAILFSMSRGCLIAATVILLVYMFRYGVSWRTLTPMLVVAALLLIVPDRFFVRLQDSFADRAAGRFDIWHVGLVALTQPQYGLIGAGVGNFPLVSRKYIDFATVFPGFNKEAHNTYLSIAVELGIVGFTFFAAALVSQFRRLRFWRTQVRNSSQLIPYEAAMWGVLTAAFSIDVQRRKFFWFACILLAMAIQVLRDQKAAGMPELLHPPAEAPYS